MRVALVFLALALALLALAAVGDVPEQPEQAKVMVLQIKGGIGPATRDHLSRGLRRAGETGAAAVVIQIDTPGGLDASTRDINQAILASKVPTICWVAPEGARAASAGTYILYACHLAAMAPATSLGAATPVSMSPPGPGGTDRRKPAQEPEGSKTERDDAEDADADAKSPVADDTAEPATAMERKVLNDAVSYILSLAELRGRNAEFAEAAVRQAKTLTARQALEQGVIEFIATDMDDLLAQADGRSVGLLDAEHTLATAGAAVERIEPDWRNRLLSVITDPSVAYILLLVGLYGLVLEGYSPGAILPGVVGAIALLLALYALQVLPVNYAGVLLIVLGVALLAAELMAPSFGILGMGGMVALIAGSLLMYDTDVPGFGISLRLIVGIAVSSGLAFLGVLYLAVRARERPVVTGWNELFDQPATVVGGFPGLGRVHTRGEHWQAYCAEALLPGQPVQVTAVDGLVLQVQPFDPSRKE